MKTKLNIEASGDSFDLPDRPINLAMQLARHKANDLERKEIGKSLVPHLKVGENIDTGALRILAAPAFPKLQLTALITLKRQLALGKEKIKNLL